MGGMARAVSSLGWETCHCRVFGAGVMALMGSVCSRNAGAEIPTLGVSPEWGQVMYTLSVCK